MRFCYRIVHLFNYLQNNQHHWIEVKLLLLHNQFVAKNKTNQFVNKFNFQTTGLTGLLVSQHPHHELAALYGKTLRALAKMPENATYRVHTEKIVRERASIVSTVSIATLA